MTGVSVSTMKPSDIALMPYFSNGRTRFSITRGLSVMPSIIGTDGP